MRVVGRCIEWLDGRKELVPLDSQFALNPNDPPYNVTLLYAKTIK